MTEWLSPEFATPDDMEDALARFEAERQRLRDFEARLAEASTTVLAKDRSMSMTFDGHGELTALTFNGASHRSMAPAELAHVIVETVRAGRKQSLATMSELMGGPVLADVDVADLASGAVQMSELLDALIAPFGVDGSASELAGGETPAETERRHG